MTDVRDIEIETIDGNKTTLRELGGSTYLIVNVASACGFTRQYEGMQALYEANQSEGLVVVGFPCNQFGAQEPGSNEEVFAFAVDKYQANFPMFSKIDVNGSGACELYQWLKAAKADEEGGSDIPWNFAKFLIDKSGQVVARFSPQTSPEELDDAIKALL